MTRYSVQPRIFVKGYGFLSFAKNIDTNISKSLSGKYSQKLLDHAKNLEQVQLRLLQKKPFKITAEATRAFIDNKIANKITKV